MASQRSQPLTRTIDLDRDQLLVIDNRPGTRVQVLFGGVWLTEESSFEDRFAGHGQWLALEARGRAIVESRTRTRLRVFDPAPGYAESPWRAFGRWLTSSPYASRALAGLLALAIGFGLPDLLDRGLRGGARGPGTGGQALANWSSPTLGTSDGRPTTSGSTGPTAARSRRV